MTAIRKHIRNTIAGALLLSGTALAGDAVSAGAAPVAATIPAHARLPRTNSGPTNWSTDAYQYDASGNIIAIGQQSFIYDTTNRLVSATTAMPVDGQADAMQTETFNYDVYGNMTDRTVDSLTTTSATDATTNRLTAFSAQYDTAGNLTHMQPPGSARTYDYDYDSFNMLRDMRSPTSNPAQPYWVIYIYTADDQRLWTYNVSGNVSHWTIRDLGGNVLRDFKNDGNAPAATQWSLSRDYIYRDGALLAAVTPTGSEHFTLDHLGTPRLITSATGVRIGQHTYRAFGNERSNLGVQEDDPRKFTGHERDHDPAGETVAELDYMHARYYNAALGRFLSMDPAYWSSREEIPQSWNRYTYAINNPIRFTDPNGLDWFKLGGKWTYLKDVQEMQYEVYKDGKLVSSELLEGTKFGLVFNGTGLTELRQDGTTRTFPAASGVVSGWGEIHPEQQKRNAGPIPEGTYTFHRVDIQEFWGPNADYNILAMAIHRGWRGGTHSWGTHRVPLDPAAGTKVYGRSGFFLHGSNNGPGSHGCIDLCDMIGELVLDIPRSVDEVPVDVDYGNPLPKP
jgi:RHS repeat-associated protein